MSKNTDLVYNWAKDIYDILYDAEKTFNGSTASNNYMIQKGMSKMLVAKGYAQAIMTTMKPNNEDCEEQ